MTGRDTQRALPSRRDVMMAAATTAAAPLASTPLLSTATLLAQGFVFVDVEGTGIRARAAPGIPNVMVSNGRDVALTARDGSWRLPVLDGNSVFVIKPSGWTTLQDRYARPKFAHLYQPARKPLGSRLSFRRCAPNRSTA